MGQVRYLDGARYTFVERQEARRTDGSSGFTVPSAGFIYFSRCWLYEPISVDEVSAELLSTSAGAYMLGLYTTNPATGLPTGIPAWQSPSAPTLVSSTTMLRAVSRTALAGPATLWAAFTQSGGAQWAGTSANIPAVEMGVSLTNGVGYHAWRAAWTYNPSGLPDVTGFTFAPVPASPPGSQRMPIIRWRTSR